VNHLTNHHFLIGMQIYFAFLCNMKNDWMSTLSERKKLLLFGAFVMIGMGLGSMLMFAVAQAMSPAGTDVAHIFASPQAEHAELLKWANTSMLIGFFLFPVLLFQWLFRGTAALPLHFTRRSLWWWIAPALLFFLSGMVDIAGSFNTWLMQKMEWSTLEALQTQADHLQELMLKPTSLGQWIGTLVAVVIGPAVLEELFFRGALQNLFMRIGRNPHTSIWASAIAFSAVHMQFEGFLPRLMLGALMGYLYYWSGSITTAIIAHAFNNLLALCLFQFFQTTEWHLLDQPWLELLVSFGFGFVGIALTQWAYRRGHAESAARKEGLSDQ
jgi:membrane protease YdiL (CAAX protease family)